MKRYTVAIHELDRNFGGREEGGWYYDSGIPDREHAKFTKVFSSLTKANRYARRLNRETVPGLCWGRSLSSVCYSGGQYQAIVQTGTNAREWPEVRPRYC